MLGISSFRVFHDHLCPYFPNVVARGMPLAAQNNCGSRVLGYIIIVIIIIKLQMGWHPVAVIEFTKICEQYRE